MRGQRRFRAGVARLGLLAATAALVAVPAPARAADQSVTIQGFAFNPPTVTVDVGDSVTWTNLDGVAHTATAEDGSFDSGNLGPTQSFAHTFGAAGTFPYRCDIHTNMEGTVVVRSAAAATTAPPPPPTTAPPATNPPATSPPRSATTVARATTTTALPVTTTTLIEPTTTSSTEQTVVAAAADVDDDDDGGMGPAVGAAIALLVAVASGAAYLWWRRRGIPGAGAA